MIKKNSQQYSTVIKRALEQMATPLPVSFGYWITVVNELSLQSLDQSKDDTTYPRIIVQANFTESRNESNLYEADARVNIYIVDETIEDYTTGQRIENVYEPILYPLYDDLIYTLYRSGLFVWDDSNLPLGNVPHDKKDLFYIGVLDSNQNKLNNTVDAIEISIPNLRIRKC